MRVGSRRLIAVRSSNILSGVIIQLGPRKARRCQMARAKTRAGYSLGCYSELFIIVTAPLRSCCQCEQLLKPRFGGISMWFHTYLCPLYLWYVLRVSECCLKGSRWLWPRKLRRSVPTLLGLFSMTTGSFHSGRSATGRWRPPRSISNPRILTRT